MVACHVFLHPRIGKRNELLMHVHSQKMSASNSVKSALVDQDGLNLSGARKECFADESLADAFCI